MKIRLPSKPVNICDVVDESHRNLRWQPQQNARPTTFERQTTSSPEEFTDEITRILKAKTERRCGNYGVKPAYC
jgi:hypothetical protein